MGYYPNLNNAITKTVKQRIFDEVKARLETIQDEDGGRLFNQIIKSPVTVTEGMALPMIGIQQGPEQVVDKLWPHITKITTFYIEFRFMRYHNIDSLDSFQYYLGKLQQRLFGTPDNITLGGLSVDVQEIGNNPEIDDQNDDIPGGLLMFQIQYRHWNGDPYHLPSEQANYAYGQ